MRNCDHLNILDHMACNKTIDDLHENENLGTTISDPSKRNDSFTEEKFSKTTRPKNVYNNISNGNKPGLTELSNDKTYLETELSLRKRIKGEVEFFNKKNIQKQCALSISDATKEMKSINFVNNEKSFSEELNIITYELNSEETSKLEMLSETDLNTFKLQKSSKFPIRNCNSSLSIPYTKLSSNSIEINNAKGEDKSLSDNDVKYIDENSSDGKSNSKILNTDKNNNAFDIEIEKCYELLYTNPSEDKINKNNERKVMKSSFYNKIKDNELTVSSDISILNDTNYYLETLEMGGNKSELELSSKSINTETIWTNIKFAISPQNQKEYNFQNKVNNKDKIEVQSFDKNVNICRTFDSENINAIEPKFTEVDNSISSPLTSISGNKNEKDNIEHEQKKFYIIASDEKFLVNEDDLLAYNEFEMSMLADESRSINGKENDCDDDYEVFQLEDDTVIHDNNEISNKKESNSNKGLSVETKSNIDLSIHEENERKAICVKDNDENITSKEVTVNYFSFNKKMYSGSNEMVFNNNVKELNSGNKLEEIISNSMKKNISEDIVPENEKMANDEKMKKNIDRIPDYFEDEKEDLINPGWNMIKELSNDEERYRQVRDCWKSASIPNPNKNLTYHSFRKRPLNIKEIATRVIKQHKRQATSNLNNQHTKRSRLCTFTFDNHIQSKVMEKKLKTEELKKEMNDKINNLKDIQHQQEVRLQSHLLYYRNKAVHMQNYHSELKDIQRYYRQQISSVTNEYRRKMNKYDIQYQSGIKALKKNRNEVFQFYSFYKGLQDEQKDPTILTNEQLQELNEIQNIYQQLDDYYK